MTGDRGVFTVTAGLPARVESGMRVCVVYYIPYIFRLDCILAIAFNMDLNHIDSITKSP